MEILRTQNNPQWDEEYPTAEVFLADIAEGTLHVYDEVTGTDSRVMGMACLNMEQPPQYTAVCWRSDADTRVIHRVAVHPDVRKGGVGSALIRHLESVAAGMDLSYLRSDTFSGNEAMKALFRKNGYEKTGEIWLRDIDRAFYCYDKFLK